MPCLIEGCEQDWEQLPIPDGPLTVGLDGGFVRARHKRGCFEVIVGKSVLEFKRDAEGEEKSRKCFGFVQTYDEKPRRRLFELLKSQGMAMNQQVTFLSDGGDDVRQVQQYLNPEAEYLLDWFHITMRITVMKQMAKGLAKKRNRRRTRTRASRRAGGQGHRERTPESEMESLARQCGARAGAHRRPAMGPGVHYREVRQPRQAMEAAAAAGDHQNVGAVGRLR